MRYLPKWTLCYGAGSIAGLITALVIWFTAALQIPDTYGVHFRPKLTLDWLYPFMIWGGVFGAVFTAPLLPSYPTVRGMILGLAPACAVLFFVFPIVTQQGLLGSYLGDNTYLFVSGYGILWGAVTSHWLRYMHA